jgi:uncharacterized protein (TIGR00369 family)
MTFVSEGCRLLRAGEIWRQATNGGYGMLPSKDHIPKLKREGANQCFGCGTGNPIGLKLCFDYSDGTVVTEFTPSEVHQGWPGFVHGGILFTLLDEAMGYTFYPKGVNGITAKVEVRFRRPAPIGEALVVCAAVTRETSRLIESKATIALKDGTVVAEGKGLMYIVERMGEDHVA